MDATHVWMDKKACISLTFVIVKYGLSAASRADVDPMSAIGSPPAFGV